MRFIFIVVMLLLATQTSYGDHQDEVSLSKALSIESSIMTVSDKELSQKPFNMTYAKLISRLKNRKTAAISEFNIELTSETKRDGGLTTRITTLNSGSLIITDTNPRNGKLVYIGFIAPGGPAEQSWPIVLFSMITLLDAVELKFDQNIAVLFLERELNLSKVLKGEIETKYVSKHGVYYSLTSAGMGVKMDISREDLKENQE